MKSDFISPFEIVLSLLANKSVRADTATNLTLFFISTIKFLVFCLLSFRFLLVCRDLKTLSTDKRNKKFILLKRYFFKQKFVVRRARQYLIIAIIFYLNAAFKRWALFL